MVWVLLLLSLNTEASSNKMQVCIEALKTTGVTSEKNLQLIDRFLENYGENIQHMKEFLLHYGTAIVDTCPPEVLQHFEGKIQGQIINRINNEQMADCLMRKDKEESEKCKQKASAFKASLLKLKGEVVTADTRYSGKKDDRDLEYNVCCYHGTNKLYSQGKTMPEACADKKFRFACDDNYSPIDVNDPRAKEFNAKYNKLEITYKSEKDRMKIQELPDKGAEQIRPRSKK